jgi:hypothetical protein
MHPCTCGCGTEYADDATASAFGADHRANRTGAADLDDLDDEQFE